MLQSLLCDTVQLATGDSLLVLNSALDPFVLQAAQQLGAYGEQGGKITLAEDNIASLRVALSALNSLSSAKRPHVQHVPFHEYTLHNPIATMGVAVMNLLYQPSNAWMLYGLEVADYALKAGGRLYVEGAKDRGILTIAKRMQEYFGNVETLEIKKGHRLVCSRRDDRGQPTNREISRSDGLEMLIPGFAKGNLDEGTRLLLDALEVFRTDEALDIGCGAGFLGIHIARRASKGHVTMVDASLAAVAAAQRMVEESGLTNVEVLPSDGAQAVLSQRFDLVVTNPPFHLGGTQTTGVAERFIREAAQVLRPRGRFYLVANRFLKYEPTLRACFRTVEEVGGNTRYRVIRAMGANRR